MAQTIKIKNSSVALKVPVVGDLAYGEIALNYADGKIYYKKSDNTIQSISGGGGGVWTKITTATTATPSKQYLVDTTSAAFIVTLPAAPVAGDYVYFMDAGDWTVHNLTIARNGSTIEGAIQDLVFDVKGILVQMVYDGTTWQVASNIGPQGASYTLNDPLGTPVSVTLTNATGLPLTTGTTGILPVAKGGTGTATPALVAGTNVTVSGTWPNQTINASSSGTVTAVTGTAPVVSSGGTTPAISMPAATSAANGYMTSTYAAKLDGIASGATTNTGTVTSVAALTLGTTGTDVTSTVATGTTTPVITLNVPTASASNRGALSAADWATFNGKQAALGFTPENAANKGVANGYAPLDASTKISSTYLPSYVDDVLEYANLAAITAATGETGKIYVALDTNKTYRWSGSAYVEISASPGSTDAVTEGSTNLYFTNTRARASISATQNITYNSTTGVITGPVLSGYLTSYTETDTLATVTARGATTTVVPTFSNGATVNGPLIVGWNIGGAYPVSGGYGILSWNFSSGSGETNFWNGYTPANVSFTWLQKTGTSAATNLMQLSPTGFLTTTGGATINGNTVIAVTDNTNAALRITQLGTGNALLVEDSTNPDATPFVIDAAGNVGIGTTSPTYKLDIIGSNLGTTAGNQSNIARLFSGSGNNDYLEVTNTRTASGGDWTTAGFRFQQKIDATWMAWQQFNGYSNTGGITWGTGTSSTSAISLPEAMRLTSAGSLGIGTTSPGSKLTVAGQIESTLTGFKFPDGTVQATAASGANWTKITTTTTATTKKQYVTDTTAGAFTVTLPATPAAGDYVYFMDAGNWATNNLTVARNGTTIEASATDLVLDVKGLMVQLIYDGSTWQVTSNIGPQGPIGPIGVTGAAGLAGTPALNIVTTTTQTAVAYNQYVLTNIAVSTLTLPASPTAGDIVWVTPGNGLITNVMARNGNNIMGIAEDMTMNNASGNYQMRYINATLGWRIM